MPLPTDKSSTVAELHNQLERLHMQVAELSAANRRLQKQPAEPDRQADRHTLQSLAQVDQILQQNTDLDGLMTALLQEALQIFGTDRAWLLYPCDPDAPSWQVLMECSRDQDPGAFTLKTDLPMLPEAREVFQRALTTKGPVCYHPERALPLPQESAKLFSIQSQITLAIRPRVGKPWLFGMHQCSHPRVWSDDDCRLFEQIGRRLPDGFSSLLTYRQLQESEQKYKSLVANIPAIIYRRANDADWTISYISAEIKRLTGYPASDFIANQVRSFAGICHPEDRQSVDDAVQQAVARQAAFEIDYRLLTSSGRTIWVRESGQAILDPQGRLLYLDGAIFDITASKAAETELIQLRQLLTDIINAMPLAVISVDEMGKVNQWNNGAEQLSEIETTAAIGQPITELLPELCQRHPKLCAVFSESRMVKIPRYSWRHAGEERSKEITAFPLNRNDGGGAVIRIEDIHDRLQMEQALIQSEKMLSVGTLAAGMAHEINNPLAAIMQSLQVISNRFSADLQQNLMAAERAGTSLEALNRYLKERQIDRLLEGALSSSDRVAEIVRNLLTFSRKADSGMLEHDIEKIIEQALDLAANDFNLKHNYDFRNILLECSYDPDLPKIRCENSQLQQVFLTLLNNSAQAMSEKQQRLPEPQRHSYQPKISLSVRLQKNRLRIEIADNGCGMDPATRKRIFEPFYTTKKPGAGTGLGMAICYYIIVSNHAGHLSVDSTAEIGTRVSIELPIYTA